MFPSGAPLGSHHDPIDRFRNDQFRIGVLCQISSERQSVFGGIGEGQGHENFVDIFSWDHPLPKDGPAVADSCGSW